MKSFVGLLLALLTLNTWGLAQWNPWISQTTGLPSGYEVMGLHAVDDNIVWGIGSTNGISQYFVRTTNGGTTWTCSTISAAPAGYGLSGIYAFDANRAWVSMYNNGTSTGGGIFKTIDGGATWEQVPTLFSGSTGEADFIYFFDENHGVCVGKPIFNQVFSEMYLEIYTTSDGGLNWSRIPKASLPPPDGAEGAIFHEFTATSKSLWFPTVMMGSGRFIRTTDRGATWTLLQFPDMHSGWAPTLEFQSDSIGLGQGSLAGIMKTTDGGLTWNLIPNTSWLALNHLEYVPGTPGMYVGASVFNAQSPSASWIWGTVITFDGGLTWIKAGGLTGGYADLRFASPVAGWRADGMSQDIQKWSIPSGQAIMAMPESVSFGTIEAGSTGDTVIVEAVNYEKAPVTVTSLALPGVSFKIVQQPQLPVTLNWLESANMVFAFSPNKAGVVRDSLVVFSSASSAPRTTVSLMGMGFVSHAADSSVLYAASGSLFSIESESHFATLVDTLGGVSMYGLAIQPSTHELYGVSSTATSTTLYRINSATAMTMPVCAFSVGDTRGITFLAGDTLYAVTTGGRIYQIYAASGRMANIGMAFGISCTGVAIGPGGILWLSGSDSDGNDNIYTFDESSGEAAMVGRTGVNVSISSIVFDSQGNLYGLKGAGTDTSSFISIDKQTAARIGTLSTGTRGLTAMTVSGAYSFPTGGVDYPEAAGVPKVFALEQNYPNPFNPKTVVRSQTPIASHVKLVVYDILGREVAVLVNERRAAGYYQDTFDASGLSSGVYFYRLEVRPLDPAPGETGDFVQTRKLVLMR